MKIQRPLKTQRPTKTQRFPKTERPMKIQSPASTPRLRTLVGAITTVGIALSLLTAAPASAQTSAARAADDHTGFAVPPASVPVVDSQLGVGTQATSEPTSVDVVRGDSSPRSALVRITALEPAAATDVSAAGAVALHLEPGATASTTVLVPLAADGTFPLAASTPVDTRVEPVAYFGDATAPGSVTSLPEPLVRTEEGGDALSPAGAIVGLTGLGGVPSTGVRSVFVTAAFTSTGETAGDTTDTTPRTVSLDGIDIPVEDGSVVSTFITPSVSGDTLITGPADVSVTLTVRGWVAEAAQSETADQANVTGSVVPAIGTETVHTDLVENEASGVARGELPADSHALALVWADAATIVTAISAGSAPTGRTTGAVVDAARGAAPQLLLLDPEDSALRVSRGDVDAHSRIVASIVGAELPRATDLDISVTSPAGGATVDLGETGGTVVLSGEITVESGDLAAVEIKQGDTSLGSPELRYDSSGITWAFETAAPESGTYDFTVTATDRSGAQDSATVRVTITLPSISETVIVDNVQILDDPSTVAVTALTDDTVVVVCQLDVGPGDFIVAGSIPGAPEGFLRRIRAVDITDAGAVLHTEPALLTDVIIQANVDEEHDLGEGGGTIVEEAAPDPEMITVAGDEPTAWTQDGAIDTTGFTELTEDGATGAGSASRAPAPRSDLLRPFGVGAETGVEASSSVKIGMELSKDLGPATDASKTNGAATKKSQELTGGFYVEASASASVKLGIDVEVWVTWSWAIPTPHINFETAFTMSAKLTATFAAYLKASTSTQTNAFKKDVAKYHFPGITVYLGIPVWVTPKVSLGVTGEVSATASVEYTLEQSATKKIGVSCEDGVCSKIDDTPKGADGTRDLDAVKGVFSGGGKLEASVGPSFSASALLYGFAGPEISLSFKLGGAASIEGSSEGPTISGAIDIFLKVSAGLDLVVEIPIFEIVVIEWTLGAVERKFILHTWTFEHDLSEPSDPPGEDSGSSGTKPTPGAGGDGDGTRDSIDVMFVIDTTGSMSSIIQATLDKARDIATRMNASARSARIGLVEYRDYGDEFMARTVQPLTEDLTAFGTALDTLYANGGGDWEEAVYSGIVTALAEDWRPSAARTIIVMGDAPAHDPDAHTGYTASQIAGFLGGDALCRNGEGDIIGGPTLPACGPMGGASFSALASPQSSASARLAPSENTATGLPVILFGISSDWSGTLTEQLRPLAEGSGGTVADIDGADAVGDAIDAALEAAGAAPQPYFEWQPGDDANTVSFDGTGSVFEGESATFSYDFGDGSDAVTGAAATTHSFAAPGTYDVTLTITDEKGRTAEVVASVTVADDSEPEWGALDAAADRGDAQAGESVTFTAAGLQPGGRVSVAWDGTVGAATGVVGDDGVVSITLAVPAGAAPGELGYTMRALDEHRVGSGVITVNPTVAVCAA